MCSPLLLHVTAVAIVSCDRWCFSQAGEYDIYYLPGILAAFGSNCNSVFSIGQTPPLSEKPTVSIPLLECSLKWLQLSSQCPQTRLIRSGNMGSEPLTPYAPTQPDSRKPTHSPMQVGLSRWAADGLVGMPLLSFLYMHLIQVFHFVQVGLKSNYSFGKNPFGKSGERCPSLSPLCFLIPFRFLLDSLSDSPILSSSHCYQCSSTKIATAASYGVGSYT